jgi:hypothetical protein
LRKIKSIEKLQQENELARSLEMAQLNSKLAKIKKHSHASNNKNKIKF